MWTNMFCPKCNLTMIRKGETYLDYDNTYYYECTCGNRVFIRDGQTEEQVLEIINSIVR